MKEVKNIILDLGGVVFDIDYKKTIEAFGNLSINNPGNVYSKITQVKIFDELEKGNIPEIEFYSALKAMGAEDITNEQIRDAWNAMLIGLPEQNVQLLTELKKHYRLFLLSNTNLIHEKAYRQMIKDQYGSFILEDFFEKMYLSHHLHMRKPDPEIFTFVINDSGLKVNETIFIDDSVQHIEGARKANIPSFHLKDQNLKEFINGGVFVER
jgi:putative hydrolase of the HAD superfamily